MLQLALNMPPYPHHYTEVALQPQKLRNDENRLEKSNLTDQGLMN